MQPRLIVDMRRGFVVLFICVGREQLVHEVLLVTAPPPDLDVGRSRSRAGGRRIGSAGGGGRRGRGRGRVGRAEDLPQTVVGVVIDGGRQADVLIRR